MRADIGSGGDPRSGFHRHDARFHGTSPGHSRLHRILQGPSLKKHMTKKMDLQQNGRLDWFFRGMGLGYTGATLQFLNMNSSQRKAANSKSGRENHAKVRVDEKFRYVCSDFRRFWGDGHGAAHAGWGIAGNSTKT